MLSRRITRVVPAPTKPLNISAVLRLFPVTNPHRTAHPVLVPADADSYFQAPVSIRKTSDEKLTGPSFGSRLARERRSVQAQSTNLSTGFVDNRRGADFALLKRRAGSFRGHLSATLPGYAFNALHKVAGGQAFG